MRTLFCVTILVEHHILEAKPYLSVCKIYKFHTLEACQSNKQMRNERRSICQCPYIFLSHRNRPLTGFRIRYEMPCTLFRMIMWLAISMMTKMQYNTDIQTIVLRNIPVHVPTINVFFYTK